VFLNGKIELAGLREFHGRKSLTMDRNGEVFMTVGTVNKASVFLLPFMFMVEIVCGAEWCFASAPKRLGSTKKVKMTRLTRIRQTTRPNTIHPP